MPLVVCQAPLGLGPERLAFLYFKLLVNAKVPRILGWEKGVLAS